MWYKSKIILKIWNLFNAGYTNLEYDDLLYRFVAINSAKDVCIFDNQLNEGKTGEIIIKLDEIKYKLIKGEYDYEYTIKV